MPGLTFAQLSGKTEFIPPEKQTCHICDWPQQPSLTTPATHGPAANDPTRYAVRLTVAIMF